MDRRRHQAAEAQEKGRLITFDTGVLISLARREKTTWDRFRRLRERGVPILVPASCESEWWRKSPAHVEVRRAILPFVVSLTDPIACAAGEAIGSLKRVRVSAALTIDAQVMATAALRGGGAVLTSDPANLRLFARHFPRVTVEHL
jgi:predicted nucleic acid-binding protein